MSDVACVCCAPVVAEVRARGLDPETLVEGLPIALSQLEDPLRRIPWEPFRTFARRSARMLGGASELEEVAARSAHQAVPRLLRRMLPLLRSARPIYLIGARWWGPWVFRGTRATCEELADGRLREVIEILPAYGECPELFEGLRGILRAMPRLLGQPDAVVELAQDGRRAEFLIATPPARRPRGRRGARTSRRTGDRLSLPEDLEELGFRQEQLRDALQRTRVAASLLAERTRRLESIRRLGVELVWHGDVHARVEGMVRLLEEQLPVRGLRLWCRDSAGEREDEASIACLAESGDAAGPPAITRPLGVSGRRVGHLELWTSDALALRAEDEDFLGELLPWLALALDAARADRQLLELRRLLEEDATAWQRAERRLRRALVDLAGHDEGGATVVDLAERLRHWAPRLERIAGRGVPLEVHGADAPTPVVVDATLLERLLAELVAELRDAGSRRVRIEAHGAASEPTPGAPRDAIELELRGEGADTDPKARARLLDALAVAAIAPEGARLEVEASLDGEPSLRIRLPRPDGGGGETVLLVERDPALRQAARRVLEAGGYAVVEAAGLDEALMLCETSPEPIELWMTDWAEPSFDLAAARRAMDHHPELRGVVLLKLRRP